MPPVQRSDENGTYYTIGTAAWYGAEGAALRAQGWQYCGFGTYGIITAPPGAPCFRAASGGGGPGQPNIGPTAPPPDTPAPTSGVADKACGRCSSQSGSAPTISPTTGPTTVSPTQPKARQGIPWWVWVLATLTLAQVVHGRNT